MSYNSVRLTRSSGAGGRSSWSATGAVLCPRYVRNNSIEVLDLARDPGLLCDTLLLGVDVTGQASRAVSRGTLDSRVPQVAKPSLFCSQHFHGTCAHGPDRTFIKRPYYRAVLGGDLGVHGSREAPRSAMFAGGTVVFTRATVMSVAATVMFVAADATHKLSWARGGCARGKTRFSCFRKKKNRGSC